MMADTPKVHPKEKGTKERMRNHQLRMTKEMTTLVHRNMMNQKKIQVNTEVTNVLLARNGIEDNPTAKTRKLRIVGVLEHTI